MNDTEASKILAELAAEYTVSAYDPDQDVMVMDLVRQTGITFQSAQKKLNRMVSEGRLEKRTVRLPDQRPTVVYRRASSA